MDKRHIYVDTIIYLKRYKRKRSTLPFVMRELDLFLDLNMVKGPIILALVMKLHLLSGYTEPLMLRMNLKI